MCCMFEKPAPKEQRLVTLQRFPSSLAAYTLKSLGPHMVTFLNTKETMSIKLILRARTVYYLYVLVPCIDHHVWWVLVPI